MPPSDFDFSLPWFRNLLQLTTLKFMKVLVGCEESGVVSAAFRDRGHEVLSCDLQATRGDGAHYKGDIFDVIDYPWDLAVFHPPCTHTAVSGARHFAKKRQDGRQYAGISFIHALVRRSEHVPRVAIEQPVSILSSLWRPPDQVIQPWQFGHGETKATCLWLRGVPMLQPTNVVTGREARVHKMAPGPDRARERSVTYQGIADAMASQWGNN
jgi:hypothetical protein